MTREQPRQLSGGAYQVTETIAILQRSIWRRARHVASGANVLLHSLRSGVAEPRRLLELERDNWQRLGTLTIENGMCEVEGELSLIVEDFSGAPLEIPEGGLELGFCLQLAQGMARLLSGLHEHGLIHGDVSPGSFLVSVASRRVEFADLLAVSAESSADSRAEFAPALAYLAPERTGRLNRHADHRADYYSLGVTLFQMLTGRLPFAATDAIGWAHAHTSKRAPLVTEYAQKLPPIVAQLVAKLLAKDPDERYQSGHGLLSDLTTLCERFHRTHDLVGLALGSHDVSSRFIVSRELTGREPELALMTRALDEVCGGSKRLVLLSGAPGTGKSALAAEFVERQSARSARLLSTAFDEQAQAVPLSGLTLALRGLAAELLSLSQLELDGLQQRVRATLGQGADILAELVPALSCVTGSTTSILPLNPIEAQRRLQHVFVSFMRVFATSERPLAFVFDDCQWLDAASSEVLSALLTAPEASHVLVLAAFRGELADAPGLLKLQKTLTQAGQAPATLSLAPLSSSAVTEIVARSLSAPVSDVRDLAELVKLKTDGNPFFIGQLLVSLHRQGALRFEVEHGRWRADLQRAKQHPDCDNVGALMAEHLDRIGVDAARLLCAAACFGMRFDLRTLSETVDVPLERCLELIRGAAVHRLVSEEVHAALGEPISGTASRGHEFATCVFEHSRVQQAALSRLSDLERVALHARIGRLLRARLPADAAASQTFAVLHHLNAARAELREPAERLDLLRLNLAASQKALQTGAWSIAASHAEIACELVDDEPRLAPDLAFRAVLARAESAFLLADPRCDDLCEQAFALAPDVLARGRVHVLKTRILEHGGRMAEAVTQVRAALGEFGVRLPETPDEINQGIGEGIGKLQAHLARVGIEGLPALPKAEDSESRLILELLAQVIPPAFQTYPPLFILAELVMFDRSLSRGVDAVSCKNFADCSIILMAFLGDYDAAYRLGTAAFELLKRFAPTPVEAGICFVFAGFLSHWKEPYPEVFAIYDRAEKSGLALGDLQHVAYAKSDRVQRSFWIGAQLRACREQVAETRRYLTHISATGQLVNALVVERAVARLTANEAQKEAVAAADRDAMAVLLAEKSAQYCFVYGQAQLMTSFILGDFLGAQRWVEFTRDFLMIAPGQFCLPDYQLFEALLAVRAHREGPVEAQEQLQGVIEKNLQQLQTWSRLCPENFAHKYHLLAAESARLSGQPLEVTLAHYRDALRTAGDGFVQLRALVYEHQARLWLSLEDSLHARSCLEAAYRLYADWGATAKLELLAREYPALLADVIRGEGSAAQAGLAVAQGFDSASLLKATQSIFVEVEPERLFAALMTTLIENAGAEHGCLILRDEADGAYYVEARAHVERSATSRTERVAYGEADYLCASVVSYVLRTVEPVTLDDAAKSGTFRADPQIRKRGVRSVLCAPIMRQGLLMGVLYVENNVSAYAFTRERVAALQVIASQAAISIYNAQLYESLERRVAQRTEELALKNRQIASMLDNLEQGVFTVDRAQRIEPGYSRQLPQIFGTTELVGRDCLSLLTDGAAVRPDVLASAEVALGSAFEQEAWLAELNTGHLIREVERTGPGGQAQFLEIAWSFIASESELVERVLVTVRDVTVLRDLKQTARNKAREVDIIVQVLDWGLDAIQDFCANCRQLLAENRAALAPELELSQPQIAAAFRNLHTLKGDARLHDLTHLVDCLHTAEDAYDALRQQPDLPPDRPALLKHLDAVQDMVGEYERISQEKLGAADKKGDDSAQRVLRDIQALVESTSLGEAGRDLLPELRGIVARLEPTSLARLVDETRAMLPSLAAELDKPAPVVLTQQTETRLSLHWTKLVKDVLVQCFRNSLYHGIEMPAQRELAGKSPHGSIHVRVRSTATALELQLFDDGRGLALAKLRQRDGRGGLSDEALAEQIFQSGVSTAETVGRVAGRGVGLDIVRANLQARGGDALLRFTADERDGYRPFMLVILLPKEALASGSGSGERPSVRPPGRSNSVPVTA